MKNGTYNTKINTLFIAVLTLCTFTGGVSAEDRGGYAGTFLRLGLGARAKAMGGAYVGRPVDGYSGYYNPAGLTGLKRREVQLSYRNLSLDRSFYYAGYAAPLPPQAGIAVGWINAGIDNIDGRDNAGNHTQMYSDSQNGLLFGFGLRLPKGVSIGIGGTYLRETLVDITATGFGFNLGLNYNPFPFLSFGFAIRDIGAHYTWNSESLYEHGSTTTDDFPTVFTGGAGIDIERYDATVIIDVFKNSKSDAGLRIGIEKNIYDTIQLRAGIDDEDITAGIGISFPMLNNTGRLDYAVGTSDIDPESVHIISFSVMF